MCQGSPVGIFRLVVARAQMTGDRDFSFGEVIALRVRQQGIFRLLK
jgi:hypothetical protein